MARTKVPSGVMRSRLGLGIHRVLYCCLSSGGDGVGSAGLRQPLIAVRTRSAVRAPAIRLVAICGLWDLRPVAPASATDQARTRCL